MKWLYGNPCIGYKSGGKDITCWKKKPRKELWKTRLPALYFRGAENTLDEL